MKEKTAALELINEETDRNRQEDLSYLIYESK